MFFTLDRTEDGSIAVMISDEKERINVPFSDIDEIREGSVYTFADGLYIYNEKETLARKSSNKAKFNELLKRAKNKR